MISYCIFIAIFLYFLRKIVIPLQIFGSMLLAFIPLAILTWIVNPKVVKVYDNIKLYSLQDNFDIKGEYYLFSGVISEEPVYRYYYEVSDDKYKLGSCYANQATVMYTEGKPKLEWYTFKLKNKKYSLWLACGLLMEEGKQDITFHIPKGSIANEYKLDLK